MLLRRVNLVKRNFSIFLENNNKQVLILELRGVLSSKYTMNSSSSRNPSPGGNQRLPPSQYKFNEMGPIDENEISAISPSPDQGYPDEDSENLRLFPKRHPEWLISSNQSSPNPYQSPSTSLSRSPKNLPMSMNGDNRPLLINNGNMSSTSGRNGAALNRISNTNNGTSDRVRNGKGRSDINMDNTGNSNGKPHFQRSRRKAGMRGEPFQVGYTNISHQFYFENNSSYENIAAGSQFLLSACTEKRENNFDGIKLS